MKIPQSIKDLQTLEFSRERRIWKPFMVKYDCQKIVELGVSLAQNFKRMIKHNPEVAIGVDAWIDDDVVSRNDAGYNQRKLDRNHEKVIRLLSNRPFVKILREYTANAAKHFPDEYFDLIYIDADHSYKGCKIDIEAWYPKIKKGRFIVGDDYNDDRISGVKMVHGVCRAINEFSKKHNLIVYELPKDGWAIIK